MTPSTPDQIGTFAQACRSALLDDVLPFWPTHGVDAEHGAS